MRNIFLVIIIGIFLIGVVSADLVQFDNVKSFESKSITASGTKLGTITITNFFGLGGDISKITLEKNSDFCLINCYAEGTTVLYSEGRLFDNFNFKDVNSKTSIQQNKILVEYNQNYTVDVNDYKETCGLPSEKGNGTICKSELTGKHTETRIKTIAREYKNGEVLPAGTYKWRIEGKKGLNQNVEWIANTYGLDLTEWAWWNASASYKSKITITEPNLIDRNVTGAGGWLVNITANFTTGRINSSNEIFVINSGETVELESSVKNITRDGDWITQAEIYFRLNERVSKAGSADVYIYYDCDSCGPHSYTKNYTNMQIVYQTGTATEYTGWSNYSSITGTTILYQQEAGEGNPAPDFYEAFNTNAYGILNTYRYFTPTNPKTRVLVDLYHASARGASGSTGFKLINATENPSGWGYGGQICAVTTTNAQLSCWGSPETTGMAWTKVNSSTTFLNIMPYNNMTLSLMCRSGSDVSATPAQVCRMDNIIFLEQFDGTFAQGAEIANIFPPVITLNQPVNYANSSSNSVIFNCSASDDLMIVNASLWINGIRNYTLDDGLDNFTSIEILRSLSDGKYNWTCSAYDNETIPQFTMAGNRTLTIDTTAPIVTVIYPTNTTYTTTYATNASVQINLNATYSDTNLQSCWIYNGTGNTTLTCGTNMTITTGYSSYYFIFYANDTFGNLGSANVSANWDYTFLQNSATYNQTSYETTLENFILNSSYDTSKYYSSSAKLNYNGTDYTSTKTAGTNTLFSNTITVPLTSTSANYSFYWIINLINSSGTFQFNSTSNNQSISPLQNISINSTCNAGFSPAFNFSIYAESNQTSINASSITYNLQYGLAGNNIGIVSSGSLANTNVFSICINDSYPTYSVGYGEIDYQQTGFNPRRFYIFSNTRLTNTTISNPLYLLETSTSSQSFTINAKDSGLNPYSNNYISLLRWYPDLNVYKIVDMGKTDSQGNTQVYVRLNDIDYRVGLYSVDGTLIQLDSPTRFTCAALPCVYPLYVRTQQSYTNLFGIQQSLTYSNSTGISTFTYIWNDPSQTTTLMNLTVWKETGTDSTLECSSSSNSFTGVLSCSLPVNSTGTFKAEVYRSASPSQPIITLIQSITIEAVLDVFIKLFFGFLIAAVIIFMGVYMGIVPAVFFGIIACVVLVFFGVVEWWMAAGIILIGIVILNTIKKT